MQYRIKSPPYLVFYTFELNKGKSVVMSSEKWKPCGVVTCNAVTCNAASSMLLYKCGNPNPNRTRFRQETWKWGFSGTPAESEHSYLYGSRSAPFQQTWCHNRYQYQHGSRTLQEQQHSSWHHQTQYRQTLRHKLRQSPTDRQTDRQTDTQKHTQTNIQRKQTNRHSQTVTDKRVWW